MHFIKTSFALLIGFSANARIETGQTDFSDVIRAEEQYERCADKFTQIIQEGSRLSQYKIVQLAQALCTHPEILYSFLKVKPELTSDMGQPLMLALRYSKSEDLAFTLSDIRRALFPGKFFQSITRGININTAREIKTLTPSERNVLTVDLDAWIKAKRDQKSPGMLKGWLDQVMARHDVLVTAVAVARHEPEYYRATGHHEVSEFLRDFHPVYFAARAPKAGNCQNLL